MGSGESEREQGGRRGVDKKKKRGRSRTTATCQPPAPPSGRAPPRPAGSDLGASVGRRGGGPGGRGPPSAALGVRDDQGKVLLLGFFCFVFEVGVFRSGSPPPFFSMSSFARSTPSLLAALPRLFARDFRMTSAARGSYPLPSTKEESPARGRGQGRAFEISDDDDDDKGRRPSSLCFLFAVPLINNPFSSTARHQYPSPRCPARAAG